VGRYQDEVILRREAIGHGTAQTGRPLIHTQSTITHINARSTNGPARQKEEVNTLIFRACVASPSRFFELWMIVRRTKSCALPYRAVPQVAFSWHCGGAYVYRLACNCGTTVHIDKHAEETAMNSRNPKSGF
jgi:hypothetical protein